MNWKTLGYLSLVVIGFYLAFNTGIMLIGQAYGMKVMMYHPQLPINDQNAGNLTISPQILEIIYIGVTMIYFLNQKWGWKKNDDDL